MLTVDKSFTGRQRQDYWTDDVMLYLFLLHIHVICWLILTMTPWNVSIRFFHKYVLIGVTDKITQKETHTVSVLKVLWADGHSEEPVDINTILLKISKTIIGPSKAKEAQTERTGSGLINLTPFTATAWWATGGNVASTLVVGNQTDGWRLWDFLYIVYYIDAELTLNKQMFLECNTVVSLVQTISWLVSHQC